MHYYVSFQRISCCWLMQFLTQEVEGGSRMLFSYERIVREATPNDLTYLYFIALRVNADVQLAYLTSDAKITQEWQDQVIFYVLWFCDVENISCITDWPMHIWRQVCLCGVQQSMCDNMGGRLNADQVGKSFLLSVSLHWVSGRNIKQGWGVLLTLSKCSIISQSHVLLPHVDINDHRPRSSPSRHEYFVLGSKQCWLTFFD